MESIIGETIGRYKIIEELGRGGLAVVYRAVDTMLERSVAVKMILPEQQQSDKFLRRFSREARTLAQLSHPNIVKVLDYGDHQNAPYLVMEYISGGTLSGRMGRAYSYTEAAAILHPVALALHHAHQHKVIHRDVKPANILINETGQPMLADFGIVKLTETDESQSLTGTGALVGTPAYMAPEQIQGKPIDARVDVYALGIVLFELVTGRKPYIANTPIELTLKHLNEPVPRARLFVRDVPAEVEQVILKAMAKRPEDRYQDMAAFAAVLERLAAGQKAVARAATRAPETKKEAEGKPADAKPGGGKRRLGLVIGGVVGLALLAVAAVFLPPLLIPSEPTPIPTIVSPTEITREESTATTPPQAPPTATTQPTATQTATATTAPSATPTQAQSLPTATTQFENPPFRPDNVYNTVELARLEKTSVIAIDWTPDGKWIVDGASRGIFIIDPKTMKVASTISLDSDVVKSLALASDSKSLVALINNQIRFYTLDDRKLTKSYAAQGGTNSLALSPDNKLIALGVLDNKVLLMNASSGTISRVLRSNYGGWSVAFSPDSRYVAAGTSQGALMWEVDSGTWLPLNTGQKDIIKSLDFSDDGKWLAGGSENLIRIWEVESGDEAMVFTGAFGSVNSLKFLAENQLLVAALSDNTVRVWSLASKREVAVLKNHTSPVFSVAVAPDGTRMVSGAEEGVIRLWGIP